MLRVARLFNTNIDEFLPILLIRGNLSSIDKEDVQLTSETLRHLDGAKIKLKGDFEFSVQKVWVPVDFDWDAKDTRIGVSPTQSPDGNLTRCLGKVIVATCVDVVLHPVEPLRRKRAGLLSSVRWGVE